jgi:hypothetical protein
MKGIFRAGVGGAVNVNGAPVLETFSTLCTAVVWNVGTAMWDGVVALVDRIVDRVGSEV